MKILVVGLGALGTVFSCFLQKNGHNVSAVDTQEMVQKVQNKVVKVCGIWGKHSAQLKNIVSSPNELKNDFDLVILTVKSFHTEKALENLKGILKDKTRIILAQNGFGNYEKAQAYVKKENIIVSRIIFGAETINPGYSKVTVIADDVLIGSPENLIPLKELGNIANIINMSGIPCRASNEIMKFVWEKIIYNSALNSLGAILEVNYGKLAEMEDTQKIMNKIIEEIFNVLEAMGEKISWPNSEAYLEDFYSKLVPVTANHHASMLQDIQLGRHTEIDALNGAICSLGKKYNISTPVNWIITKLVKAKEKLVQK
ncbi:MAG: 2-dehydropantoate 2-reductase [Clostridia bacterium]|nr:2-dehydropantoate 2-reductase [Clostridia bacterium]